MNILSETKHEQRLELYKQGLTDAEIAQKVGVHPITIYKWRRKQGIPPNRKKKPVTRPKIVDEPIIWYSPQEFLRRWEGGFESRPLRQNRRENIGKCKEKEKYCYGCKHLYSEFGAAGKETYFCKKYGIILAQQDNWIQSNPLRCDRFEEIGGEK